MAVFRIEKTRDYTVMANHHLKNRTLSLKAKGLLSMMLSLPDNWNYTTRGLAAICKEGVDSIGAVLRELEAQGYVVRTQQRNRDGRLSSTEYVIYEMPRICARLDGNKRSDVPCEMRDKPDISCEISSVRSSPHPYMQAPCTAFPATDNPSTKKPAQLNTQESKKKGINSERIHPIYPSVKEIADCRDEVMDQIEYDALIEDSSVEAQRLDELVSLMTETLCSTKDVIRAAGEDYPAKVVKERLRSLRSDHIEYVLRCLNTNATQVHNIKSYLLTALFNAPLTMNCHFQAYFNHSLRQSAERRI